MIQGAFPITCVLGGFDWFHDGLQQSLNKLGWPAFTRPEMLIMMHVQHGAIRPADIARSLRLTRQAVHSTINALVDRGIFELAPDPEDGRIKIIVLTPKGLAIEDDSQRILEQLVQTLSDRIGSQQIDAIRQAFSRNWGETIVAHVAGGPERPEAEDSAVMKLS